MRLYRLLLIIATALALGVIQLGAYVRLSAAGLGCPDWPGCYGHLVGVPDTPHEQAAALADFPGKPVESAKAWKEMAHRYLAGTLGLLITLITALAWKHRRVIEPSPWWPTLLAGVVALQAMLGMLTVTQMLRPIIVSAHLLGGMSTLALLVFLLFAQPRRPSPAPGRAIRIHAGLAHLAVVVQIALGGWVSSNYAGLACPDFPTCLGVWQPAMDFSQAFRFHHELGQLPNAALIAIHWAHRVGALIAGAIVATLALSLCFHSPELRRWGIVLAAALALQIGLGIANVLALLPLPIALAHTTGATLLFVLLLVLNCRLGLTGRKGEATGITQNESEKMLSNGC